MTNETISFTEKSLDEFKALYNGAVETGKEKFTFEGHEFFTGYAKYMIQYVDNLK